MKKILSLLLTLLLVFTFFGCGPHNIEGENEDEIQFLEKPKGNRKYTIKLFSDPKDEYPWDNEFKATPQWKAQLQKAIHDLEAKYDCNLVIKPYNGNYMDHIEKQVATSNADASICRLSTDEALINLVAKGHLYNFDQIVALNNNDDIVFGNPELKKEYGQMVKFPFQLKVGQLSQADQGKVYTKHYGISRYRFSSLFNMFLYNATKMEELGYDPIQLWKNGQWTWDKLKEIKEKANEYIENDADFKKPSLPRSEGGKVFGFSYQFYLFDIIPQRTGRTIGLENMREQWVKDNINDFITMWRNGENQTAMWEEMTHNNPTAQTLDDIKYQGSWAEKWRAQGWSPNQHGGSKCFEIGKTFFSLAEPWMYYDAILASTNNATTRGFKIKIAPVPTDRAMKPEDNNISKITGLGGDILTVSKGNNADLATKVLFEWNNIWVNHAIDEDIQRIKSNFKEYQNKTHDELVNIVTSGEVNARLWVKEHLLSNENITEEEYDDQVAVFQFYSDPKRLTENKIAKYGFLIPYMDALHLNMVDRQDLDTALDRAKAKLDEKLTQLLVELKK